MTWTLTRAQPGGSSGRADDAWFAHGARRRRATEPRPHEAHDKP